MLCLLQSFSKYFVHIPLQVHIDFLQTQNRFTDTKQICKYKNLLIFTK